MKVIEKGSIVGLKNRKKQYALEQEFKVPFSAATTGKTVLVVDATGSHISRISAKVLEITSGEKTPNDFIRPTSIEIGGLAKEELVQKIKDCIKKDSDYYDVLHITDTAEAIVIHKDFTMLPENKTVKLIYRTVADMGFTEKWTKLSEIRDFIKAHYKNEFCDNETALWLRLVWDRVTYGWEYITTKFTSIDGGVFNNTNLPSDNPYLFHYCGSYLYNEELNPNFIVDLETVFIFSE